MCRQEETSVNIGLQCAPGIIEGGRCSSRRQKTIVCLGNACHGQRGWRRRVEQLHCLVQVASTLGGHQGSRCHCRHDYAKIWCCSTKGCTGQCQTTHLRAGTLSFSTVFSIAMQWLHPNLVLPTRQLRSPPPPPAPAPPAPSIDSIHSRRYVFPSPCYVFCSSALQSALLHLLRS